MMKVGLLLSGCGFYDGTEAAEAVLISLALERAGARPVPLAPDLPQLHTVDHLTGSEDAEVPRNMLKEAARITRGRIKTLDEQFPGELSGLVIPGGHGAVKNLMTHFAVPGESRQVIEPVSRLLRDLVGRKAPLGSVSLGRAVVQTFFGQPLPEEDMSLAATEVDVDEENHHVFTPGFLTGGSLPDVAEGIDKLARALVRMATPRLNVLH